VLSILSYKYDSPLPTVLLRTQRQPFVVADSSSKSSEASPLTGALTSAEGMKKKENYFELIEI